MAKYFAVSINLKKDNMSYMKDFEALKDSIIDNLETIEKMLDDVTSERDEAMERAEDAEAELEKIREDIDNKTN